MFGKKWELFEIKRRSVWNKKKKSVLFEKKVRIVWKKKRSVWKKWEGPK